MNKSILNLTRCAVLSFAGVPVLALAISTGDAAPGFSLPSSQGDEISLSDFAGKMVVIEWTNHKCPFVQKHYRSGNIPEQQRAAADQDIVWLSIISSAPGNSGHVDADEANAIAEGWDASPHRILMDESGDVGRAYNAKTTPQVFLINGDGAVIYQGAIDSIASADREDLKEAEQYLLSAFAALSSDEEIAVSTTAPYGCSIKY